MWTVVLKDGSTFVGKRSWWYEGWFDMAFRVVSSNTILSGTLVRIPRQSILYYYKGGKNG